MSLCGSGITRVTEATSFSASASMISAMCRAAAESIDSSQRKSARTRSPGATSCNTSRMRCAAMFASLAVTLCAALITSRRFDRSSSSAYMLGHHTKQAWSQVCHYALDFSRQQFLNHARRRCVRQMSVPRLDALFHRPRPVRVVLQKFFVVISFDYERLHFSQAFDDQLCHVTEVGDKPEAARAGVKHEPEGINRVVRHG